MRKLFVLGLSTVLFFSCTDDKKEAAAGDDTKVKSATATTEETPKQSEFADAKYMDMGKQMMADFAAGKFDAYGENFADNAVYQWSSGDSLAGKQAIVDYWKKRFADVVQSVELTNDIWLPIKVNVPQRGPDVPGVWLLNWQQVKASYKNGKVLNYWVHQDFHYNDNNKVDRVVMYMDRAPINTALGVK